MAGLLFLAFGLAVVLGGIRLLQTGLEKMASTWLKRCLDKATATPLAGFFTATAVTAAIQSSSAVTVMAISLANAGLLTFANSIGLVLGTNVGTTITSQLMTLDPGRAGLPMLALAMACLVGGRRRAYVYLGVTLAGLALIFLGLDTMAAAADILVRVPASAALLVQLNGSSFLAFLAGTVLTGVVQSSSAVTGLVMVLAGGDLLQFQSSLAIVLGANIGTCTTAVLAAWRGSTAARRIALAHVLLNAAGVAVFLILLDPFARLAQLTSAAPARQVANAHLIFNLATSLAVLPWSKQFAAVVERCIR